ncbi:beta-glucosidase [Dactylosporangium aurantiacum]|uniref:Beta-glucosidase n=1 Tax=Dactylosporangium aurantiacum TaxID=35754 RepID=A0A9Q9MET5_9ACTN|nr:GH1 family beta-glucosidase [Dactylosporangium aurantiacum]MDG6109001.1 GH1 family beta-glucosidase [Dactylosporangium aurantiacum]UWZ56498.1 beta-glucosidase [Dactylosporangium aurantiacum]
MRRRHVITLAAAGAVTAGCGPGGTPRQRDSSAPAAPVAPVGLVFPKGFGWGASTSAYQVEGGATADGRGPSVWDVFSHEPGRTRDGGTGDVAADHYHRSYEDLDLMRALGLKSYRFSISWSRVLPTGRGTVNAKGLDFYHRLVDGLLERGITPLVTLFHWDTPQALQQVGGWQQRDCAKWFADYASTVCYSLGDKVQSWLTLNEPKTVVEVGYTAGVHAPGVRDRRIANVAGHHLLLGHGLAVQAFRATGRKGRIGAALNLSPVYPADDSEAARRQAVLADGEENRRWLDPVLLSRYPDDWLATQPADAPVRTAIHDGDLAVIGAKSDLLGVQYYNPAYVTAKGTRVQKHPTTQASWQEVYPQGLYDLLTRIKRDYGDIPLTITENGMPTVREIDDQDRIALLRDHLTAAHQAISEGVRLEGYHVWSLLDNFEWAEGYTQRWGIIHVDYATQQRRRKASADWYQQVIARNGI